MTVTVEAGAAGAETVFVWKTVVGGEVSVTVWTFAPDGTALDELPLAGKLAEERADGPQSWDIARLLLSSHGMSYFSLIDLKIIGGCWPLHGAALLCGGDDPPSW